MKEQNLSEAIGLLKLLIATPSVSREEEAAADALHRFDKKRIPNHRCQ